MSDQIYSKTLADAIDDYLKSNDWHYSFDDDLGIFHFDWHIRKSRIRKLKYSIDVGHENFVTYVRPEFSADEDDEDQMRRLSECINRINFSLRVGNFALDHRDGELNFKYPVDCPDGTPPDPKLIERSIHIPASVYRRYSPALMDVMFKEADPEKAVEDCKDTREFLSSLKALTGSDDSESVYRLLSRLRAQLEEAAKDADDSGADKPDVDASDADEDDEDSILFDLFDEDDSED